jgi:hypothetical protein
VAATRARRSRVAGGRQIRVHVKLTEAEYQSVSARAIAAGLTVPSYLALVGLRPEGVAAGETKAALINARAARRVLSGVANNLNQLTAKLHSTGETDAALPAVIAAVARVIPRVDDAIAEVSTVVTGR